MSIKSYSTMSQHEVTVTINEENMEQGRSALRTTHYAALH